MKISHSLLLAASTAVAGAAGAWFLKPAGPAGEAVQGTVGVLALPGGAGRSSPLPVTAEAKASAAAVLASPVDFLKSQEGQSSLVARSRILAAVGAMSLEEIRAATLKLRALGQEGGTRAQWELTSCVYERWAELDPESLLTEAVQRGIQDQSGYLGVTCAFRELVKKDADGAWKRAQDLGPLSYYAKREILNGVGARNPQQALKLAMADGPTRRDSYMCGGFMQSWLARDRGAAVAALEALPQGEFRAGLVGQMAEAFASQDPEAALTWAAGLKNSAESSNVIRSVLQRLAGEDPRRALAMADDPKYAPHRLTALSSAVSAWGRKDFDAAVSFTLSAKSPGEQAAMFRSLNENATSSQRAKLLAIADKMSPAMAKTIYSSALNDFYFAGQSDPKSILEKVSSPAMREELTKNAIGNYGTSVEDGLELFARLQPVSQSGEQASQLAGRLAWSDPAAALKWAESLSSADLRKSALTSALETWCYSDPAAASAKAASLTDPAQREAALRAVAANWGGRDQKAALQWAESLPAGDRSPALASLVQSTMQSSPEEARKLYGRFASGLDAEGAAKAENRQVAKTLASALTESNPQEAVAWSQGLAPGPSQNEAWAGIAEKWAGYDASAASQWLTGLPEGEGRDLAADKLVSVIARDDPDSAWQWALSIGDRGKRREAAARTLEAWKAYGAKDAALAALQSGGFTGDELTELQRKLD